MPLVVLGEATDVDLLEQENVEDMDVFCAVTNDDETNIMSALLTKRMGVRKAIALINRGAYVDLVQGGQIDVAVSPPRPPSVPSRPTCVAVGAIVRGDEVLIAHHDTIIEPEDRVILFVIKKRIIPKVEKLFQGRVAGLILGACRT